MVFALVLSYNLYLLRPWLSWIERRPPEPKAAGSNPAGRALTYRTASGFPRLISKATALIPFNY